MPTIFSAFAFSMVLVVTKEAAVQEAVDAVQAMGAEALHTFAEQNFNVKLDRRKSAENLRLDAQQLIYRFGMPG